MLFIVSGASGVGKTTLCDRLRAEFPEICLSVSYTTRAARGAEVDGEHYHFVSPERFAAMVAAGQFAEHALVHGNHYGTAKATIDAALDDGNVVLFDVDYQGTESLLRHYANAVATMILPPSLPALEQRLRGRGTDSEEVIQRRLAAAVREIRHFSSFHYVLVNEQLERAYDELRAIYVAERARTIRRAALVQGRFLAETDREN